MNKGAAAALSEALSFTNDRAQLGPRGEMDITPVFGTGSVGSIPTGGTRKVKGQKAKYTMSLRGFKTIALW